MTAAVIAGALAVGASELPAQSTDPAPSFEEQIAEAEAEAARKEAEHEAYLASPEAAAERQQSRTAYTDSSGSQARSLLEDEFAATLRELDLDAARAVDELRIEEFRGERVALLDPPAGEEPTLYVSPFPLRIEEGAEKRRIDLRLDPASGGYAPRQPLVDLALPERLRDGIDLGGELKIGLEGAADAAALAVGEHDLLYPEAGPDTDLLAAPRSRGVELFWQLRSPESAEEFVLDLDLPAGAELRPALEGGAEVVRDGERLALIPPPVAADAQEREVEVSMVVEGNSLRLAAPHRELDLAYPLLVDPNFIVDGFDFDVDPSGTDDWRELYFDAEHGPHEPPTNHTPYNLRKNCLTAPSILPCYGKGLYLYAPPSPPNYQNGDMAQWRYRVPHRPEDTSAYISEASFLDLYFQARTSASDPKLVLAINGPPPGYGISSVQIIDETVNDINRNLVTCENLPPPCAPKDEGKFAYVALRSDNNTALGNWRDAYLGGARIWLRDADNPVPDAQQTLLSGQESGPGNWTHSAQYKLNDVSASDTGLGISAFEQRVPRSGGTDVERREHGCAGDFGDPCPLEWALPSTDPARAEFGSYSTDQMPEAESTVELEAEDPVTNVGQKGFKVRVDRTAPQINASGGAGPGNAVPGTASGQDVRLKVTDQGSGIGFVEVKANGEVLERFDQSCQVVSGGCSFPRDGSEAVYKLDLFEIADDRFEVEITARDEIGQRTGHPAHESSLSWEVRLPGGPPQIERIVSCRRAGGADAACIDGQAVNDCGDDAPDPSCSDGEIVLDCPDDDLDCPIGRPSPPGWIGPDDKVETAVFGRDPGAAEAGETERGERGIEAARLFLPDGTQAPKELETCGAGAGEPNCPEYGGLTLEWGPSGQFPEGISEVAARVRNPGNDSSRTKRFEVRYDSKPPVLETGRFENSPLYRQRGNLLYPQTYDLNLRGFDGDSATAVKESGMRSIEVKVDNNRVFFDSFPCDGPAYDCASPIETYTFDTAEYRSDDYTVETILTDHAGNEFTRSFDVNVRDSLGEPSLGSDRHGLEQYFAYDSVETGLAEAHANLATGNLVWHKRPIANPGRGLASIVDLTYNSYDYPEVNVAPGADSRILGLEYDEVGFGFSLGISGVTRVNEPLGGLVRPDGSVVASPPQVTMTDPDGTTHTFELLEDSIWEYRSPAGVNLHLRQYTDIVDDTAKGLIRPEQRPKAWAMTRPDGVTYFYDGWGFLRSIEDRTGNVMRFDYDTVLVENQDAKCNPAVVVPGVCEPRLAAVVDPAGTDANASAALRAERSLKLEYYSVNDAVVSARGRLKQITDHGGRKLVFEYRSGNRNQLTALVEAQGTAAERATTFGYDAPGGANKHPQLNRVTDPRGNSTQFFFQADPPLGSTDRRLATLIKRSGDWHGYGYSTVGSTGFDVATVRDGRSQIWTYTLDRRDRPTRILDPLRTATDLEWDSDNNVISLIEGRDATGQTAGDPATTRYAYNGNGQLTAQLDPLGRLTALEYLSGPGVHNSEHGANADCDESFVSDLTAIRRPAGNEWNYELQRVNSTACGLRANGNVTAEQSPIGFRSEYAYYGAATPKLRGLVHTRTDEVDPGVLNTTTYESYDASGLPTEVIDPEGGRWLYRHDPAGNLLAATDPRGSAGFDPSGPLPPTFTAELSYDALDQLKTERIPKDSTNTSIPVADRFIDRSYGYDQNGNQTLRRDGKLQDWSAAYTEMDRPETETTPLGDRARYCYDAEEGLVRAISPRGDEHGVDCDSGRGHATSYELDAIGRRVAEIREHDLAPTKDLITSYAYDRRDNRTGVSYPNDNLIKDGPVSEDGPPTVGIAEAIANAGAEATQRFAYAWDRADQLAAETENPDGSCDPADPRARTEYRYDLNGNQTRALGPRGFCEGDPALFTSHAVYDADDRLIGAADELGNTTAYALRLDGKLKAEVRPRGVASPEAGDFTVTYTYDANGHLTSRSLPRAPGQYGRMDLRVVYVPDEVGDPETIVDARGNAFANEFLDTGQLESTTRPSWWQLDWGPAAAAPDPGIRFGATDAGATPDLAAPEAGPALAERGGPASGAGSDKGPAPPETQPLSPGDFGRVEPEALPEMLPLAGDTDLTYDDELRLEAITDVAAAERRIVYDEAGRIEAKRWPVSAERSISHSYGYDPNGNLTSYADGVGSWSFAYDDFDRLSEESAPGSADTRAEIDALAAGSAQLTPEVTTFGYDPNGNLTDRITPRPNDNDFAFAYDPLDRLKLERNPAEEAWAYAHDVAGNRISETGPRGVATAEPGDHQTSITFDAANRPVEITDPLGFATQMSYDPHGNLTRLVEPGARETAGSEVAPHVTETTYDGRDLPWATTTGTGDAERTTVTEYDPNGNLRRVVNPAGVGTNRLPLESGATLAGGTENATVHEYSPDDLPTAIYLPWDGESEKRYKTSYGRDTRGRIEKIRFAHEVDQSATDRVAYTHYDTGWIRTSTDPAAGQVPEKRVEYFYDDQGNQTQWSALGPDDGRDIKRLFNPNGTLARRQAEGAGQACEQSLDQNPYCRTYDHFYNANRSLIGYEDRDRGRSTTIYRDGAERERVVDEEFGRDTLLCYDAASNTTDRYVDGTWNGTPADARLGDCGSAAGHYADPTHTGFTYDRAEREVRMEVDPAGPDGPGSEDDNRVTTTSYHPSGQVEERAKLFSGVSDRFLYADDGRLAERIRTGAGSASGAETYLYDRNGNRTEDERGSYDYNARDQLTRWTRNNGSSVNYTLDGSGAVTEKEDAGTTTLYDYTGDRLNWVKEGTEERTHFEYNDFGSVECARLATQACSAEDSVRYIYDDFERRTGSSEEQDTTYGYDALDRRDFKRADGKTHELSYLGTTELLSREVDSGGRVRAYDYDSRGDRQGFTATDSTSKRYQSYGKDVRGSVEVLENRDGTVDAGSAYDYDPYGDLENEGEVTDPEALANPFRFEGFYYDSEVGTYDMLARTYRPEIARFLSEDRFEQAGLDLGLQADPLTQNRYVFAGANPVTNVEFDGHIACTATCNPGEHRQEYGGNVSVIGASPPTLDPGSPILSDAAGTVRQRGASPQSALASRIYGSPAKEAVFGDEIPPDLERFAYYFLLERAADLDEAERQHQIAQTEGGGLDLQALGELALLSVGPCKLPGVKQGCDLAGRGLSSGAKRLRDVANRVFGGSPTRAAGVGIRFGQRGVSGTFRHGEFAGQSVDDVAAGLRAERISPDQLPIQTITRDGVTYTMNNRSLLALRRAGQGPTVVRDVTGSPFFERQLSTRLDELGGFVAPDFMPPVRGGG